jgi:hypothetical protein
VLRRNCFVAVDGGDAMRSLTCGRLGVMTERPNPVFRTKEDVLLIGTMATYDSLIPEIAVSRY